MRVVLDTNIIISAIVFGGKPRAIFELIVIDKAIVGITSAALIKEMAGVLKSKFKFSTSRIGQTEQIIKNGFVVAKNSVVPDIISADPADNQVLSAAKSGKADFIISGDRHLLNLKKYSQIRIVSPTVFLEEIL